MPVESRLHVGLLKSVMNMGNIAHQNLRAVRCRRDRDIGVLAGKVTAFLSAQQHFTARGFHPTGREFNCRFPHLTGNALEGQIIGSQVALRDLQTDLQRSGGRQLNQGHAGPLQQLVSNTLGQVTQGLLILRAMHQQG